MSNLLFSDIKINPVSFILHHCQNIRPWNERLNRSGNQDPLMAILESAILVSGDTMVEKIFYTQSTRLEKGMRNNLLQAITDFAQAAFEDQCQSISLGSYTITNCIHEIEEPLHPEHKVPLQIYCIIEKNTDENAVQSAMEETLNRFTDKYNRIDIFAKKSKYFKEFQREMEDVFKDLALKSEDRFKTLF